MERGGPLSRCLGHVREPPPSEIRRTHRPHRYRAVCPIGRPGLWDVRYGTGRVPLRPLGGRGIDHGQGELDSANVQVVVADELDVRAVELALTVIDPSPPEGT